jgi:hypothetical protein
MDSRGLPQERHSSLFLKSDDSGYWLLKAHEARKRAEGSTRDEDIRNILLEVVDDYLWLAEVARRKKSVLAPVLTRQVKAA